MPPRTTEGGGGSGEVSHGGDRNGGGGGLGGGGGEGEGFAPVQGDADRAALAEETDLGDEGRGFVAQFAVGGQRGSVLAGNAI